MLVCLPLSHSRLAKELVEVSIEAMKTNSTATELIFVKCNIDDANVATLGERLKENSTLTSLCLSHNPIGEGLLEKTAKYIT